MLRESSGDSNVEVGLFQQNQFRLALPIINAETFPYPSIKPGP
jgi:hypothetical protein